ncbi:Kinesin-like protein KIN-10A [Vitis vinifera]|uniref:Kinesin-like protein KIN-10A n=1 Tax=Vitis vinifera TaxID=29760 RepID=A0A438CTP3_VITVI|nr:Kinesin-like protein KIN-10A [Vitis vinifera]
MEGKESGISEEVINFKVNERTQFLKHELEKKLQECQSMANEFVELGRKRMEEKILQQQQEVELLRYRLEEIESELFFSRSINGKVNVSRDLEGNGFAKRLVEIYADEDPGMVKSMDLDMGDQEPYVRDVRHIDRGVHQLNNNVNQGFLNHLHQNILNEEVDDDVFAAKYGDRVCLSTVFEDEEAEEDEEHKGNLEDEEVMKEIIEEKTVCSGGMDGSGLKINFNTGSFSSSPLNLEKLVGSGPVSEPENAKDAASSRRKRIQNIFTLCGNQREISHHTKVAPGRCETFDPQSSPMKKTGDDSATTTLPEELLQVQKRESHPVNEDTGAMTEVYVKWEASKENPGKFITTLKVLRDSSLADLRKLIEMHLGEDKQQAFTFLVLGDPTGAPVPREKEATVRTSKLPICNNQIRGHLACLRPVKGIQSPAHHLPLSPLENKLPLTPNSCFMQQGDGFSPQVAHHLTPTPFINMRKRY